MLLYKHIYRHEVFSTNQYLQRILKRVFMVRKFCIGHRFVRGDVADEKSCQVRIRAQWHSTREQNLTALDETTTAAENLISQREGE